MKVLLKLKFFILAVALLPVVSCSIKENRFVCPTALCITCDGPLPAGSNAVVSVIHEDDGLLIQKTVSAESLLEGRFFAYVKRGNLTVKILAGVRDMDIFDGIVSLRNATQADSLYRIVSDVYAKDDSTFVHGSPLKEFSTLSFRTNNSTEPFMFCVRSVWDRLKAVDFVAGRGDHSFNINEGFKTGENWSCRLSRQGDMSLVMEIYRLVDGNPKYDRTIPIGELMVRSGYDMNSVPMEDVHIDIDLTMGKIYIRIADWDVVHDYDIYVF